MVRALRYGTLMSENYERPSEVVLPTESMTPAAFAVSALVLAGLACGALAAMVIR